MRPRSNCACAGTAAARASTATDILHRAASLARIRDRHGRELRLLARSARRWPCRRGRTAASSAPPGRGDAFLKSSGVRPRMPSVATFDVFGALRPPKPKIEVRPPSACPTRTSRPWTGSAGGTRAPSRAAGRPRPASTRPGATSTFTGVSAAQRRERARIGRRTLLELRGAVGGRLLLAPERRRSATGGEEQRRMRRAIMARMIGLPERNIQISARGPSPGRGAAPCSPRPSPS